MKPQNSNPIKAVDDEKLNSVASSVRRPSLKPQNSNYTKAVDGKNTSFGPSSRRQILKSYQSPWAVRHPSKVTVENSESLSVLIVEQDTPKGIFSNRDPLKPQTPVEFVDESILLDVTTPDNSSPFWVTESPQQPPPRNNESYGKIRVAQLTNSLTPKLQNNTPKQPQKNQPS